MGKINRWLGVTAALGASLLLWSCDNIDNVTQPQLEPSPVVAMSKSGKRFVVAMEANPEAGSVSAKIGAGGGFLALGNNGLYVSPGAVQRETTFEIARSEGTALRLKLTATSRRGKSNDVGSKGFHAPVYFGIYYGGVANLPADESTIEVLYFTGGATVEEIQTAVDPGRKIAYARLEHFSLYGLGWP